MQDQPEKGQIISSRFQLKFFRNHSYFDQHDVKGCTSEAKRARIGKCTGGRIIACA